MSKLTFDLLRDANVARLPTFKNAKGGPAHSEPDGSDWSPCSWSNAVCGEAGELANEVKKLRRGDYTREEAKEKIASELADVICYADLLAKQFGIDLGAAVIEKFNEVSDRISAPIKLHPIADHYNPEIANEGIGVIDKTAGRSRVIHKSFVRVEVLK